MEPIEFDYVNYRPRLYATVIDSALSAIILMPLFNLLMHLLYGADTFNVGRQQFGDQDQMEQMVAQYAAEGRTGELFIGLLGQMVTNNQWVSGQLIQIFITAAVIIILWKYKSATPGKMILHMKIVDAKTGGEPTTLQWVIRFFGYTISLLPLGLGFFWMIWDKRRQCFHDKLAGTVVVKVKRTSTAIPVD